MPTHPSFDAADPYVRQAQTFPELSPEQMSRAMPYGEEIAVAAGDYLYHRNDRSVDFYVIISGSIIIFDLDDCGQRREVHRHGPCQFTGELDLFSDRKVLVSAMADGPARVLRVPRAAFRRLVTAEPIVGEMIMRAFVLRRTGLMLHGQGGVTLVGTGHSGGMNKLDTFLTRNGYPHRTLDINVNEDGRSFMACFDLRADELPVVIADGAVLRNPTIELLAEQLGLALEIDPAHLYDVVVVGAGPSGLAAAVYAASEGLDTLVIESLAPGGQAGTSSKIENYLGFPTGISGLALAGRAQVQAQKFGAHIAVAREVTSVKCDGPAFEVSLRCGGKAQGRAVIAASGARYRRLPAADLDRFEQSGVHYAATAMEAGLCRGRAVVVVGGGNSAGQAAMFLADHAAHVHLLVRGSGLKASMSEYLIDRLDANNCVTLHPYCHISRAGGGEALEWLEWVDEKENTVVREEVAGLFVMVGAEPNSDWLNGCVDLDPKGFIRTGQIPGWPFMTSHPGIFAVGDVRAESVKRVASGVGEGSVVVQFVHRWLQDQGEA